MIFTGFIHLSLQYVVYPYNRDYIHWIFQCALGVHPTMLEPHSVQAQEGGGWNNEPVLAVSGRLRGRGLIGKTMSYHG
jgi:hypothetical protein